MAFDTGFERLLDDLLLQASPALDPSTSCLSAQSVEADGLAILCFTVGH